MEPHEFEEFYDDELKELLRAYRAGESGDTSDSAEINLEVESRKLIEQFFIARHRAGLSQYDLARKASLPQSTVARMELAKSNPNLKTLVKLADALGYDVILRQRSR